MNIYIINHVVRQVALSKNGNNMHPYKFVASQNQSQLPKQKETFLVLKKKLSGLSVISLCLRCTKKTHTGAVSQGHLTEDGDHRDSELVVGRRFIYLMFPLRLVSFLLSFAV